MHFIDSLSSELLLVKKQAQKLKKERLKRENEYNKYKKLLQNYLQKGKLLIEMEEGADDSAPPSSSMTKVWRQTDTLRDEQSLLNRETIESESKSETDYAVTILSLYMVSQNKCSKYLNH